MCEFHEELKHRIECSVGIEVFDILFYGGNDGIKRYDYKGYVNCPECHRKNVLAGFPYRHHLVKPSDQMRLDNGKIWCAECASKLLNQK